MAIYMQFGSKVKGDVTTTGYSDWIEVQSIQLGAGRAIQTAARNIKNRESSEPSLSEVTVTKKMDLASPDLFMEAVAGKLDTTVKIAFTTTTQDTITEYASFELTNTAVSAFSISSGGDLPSESLSLNFSKIAFTFKGTSADVSQQPKTVGYDLTVMKKS